MDTMMTEMMSTMPMGDTGMDMKTMQPAIEACSAAAMACTMCSDACAGEGMGRCSSMCATMADMATTMMRMMMRPGGYDGAVMMAMMDACMMMGEACAAECRTHADMNDHCRVCAMACDAMILACRDTKASMMA